jgi:O-antigen biosynthesis protein WbqV
MEENPFAAARTNVLGTLQIVQAASAFGAEKMAVISTDKAVIPAGIMGPTKRIAELLVLANHSATQMNAVRLGNMLGSSGSVVPILQRQIARGGPITITDAARTRHSVTVGEAVQRLLSALVVDHRSAILVARPAIQTGTFQKRMSEIDNPVSTSRDRSSTVSPVCVLEKNLRADDLRRGKPGDVERQRIAGGPAQSTAVRPATQ